MLRGSTLLAPFRTISSIPRCAQLPRTAYRSFRSAPRSLAVKPFLLADIGEGIRECEVIQWFVEPEARVEQFDKLCEVQSDKASVEITSRYDGVIKKLHYQAGEMAIVGKPLVDIDLAEEDAIDDPLLGEPPIVVPAVEVGQPVLEKEAALAPLSKHRSLATPAVRRITRELGINITDVTGTGKEGRVLKEDVVRFAHDLEFNKPPTITQTSPPAPLHRTQVSQDDETVPLTQIQSHMFKVMTQSLAIPHFLYSDEIVLDALSRVRTNLNQTLAFQASPGGVSKLTFMPFFIKALSEALSDYPLINSRLDLTGERPQLVKRPQHNIGIAMDTPIGLIVPNIKNVAHLSILDIAAELQRLQAAGAAGKLSLADLSGGTITISNIGNIGGTVTAPVIVPSEVAIVGIGRARVVPAFDSEGKVVPRTVVNFSWSADHRIVDGATMARMAASLREMIQEPEKLLVRIR